MKRFAITFINEWEQLFGEWNWITFTPICIELQDDDLMKGYEITVIVLGLGFILRYNRPLSDKIYEELDKTIEDELRDYKI